MVVHNCIFCSIMAAVTRYLRVPTVFSWIKPYATRPDRLERVKGDVVAGLTVASVAIPQGLAYASLAGLPPIHG